MSDPFYAITKWILQSPVHQLYQIKDKKQLFLIKEVICLRNEALNLSCLLFIVSDKQYSIPILVKEEHVKEKFGITEFDTDKFNAINQRIITVLKSSMAVYNCGRLCPYIIALDWNVTRQRDRSIYDVEDVSNNPELAQWLRSLDGIAIPKDSLPSVCFDVSALLHFFPQFRLIEAITQRTLAAVYSATILKSTEAEAAISSIDKNKPSTTVKLTLPNTDINMPSTALKKTILSTVNNETFARAKASRSNTDKNETSSVVNSALSSQSSGPTKPVAENLAIPPAVSQKISNPLTFSSKTKISFFERLYDTQNKATVTDQTLGINKIINPTERANLSTVSNSNDLSNNDDLIEAFDMVETVLPNKTAVQQKTNPVIIQKAALSSVKTAADEMKRPSKPVVTAVKNAVVEVNNTTQSPISKRTSSHVDIQEETSVTKKRSKFTNIITGTEFLMNMDREPMQNAAIKSKFIKPTATTKNPSLKGVSSSNVRAIPTMNKEKTSNEDPKKSIHLPELIAEIYHADTSTFDRISALAQLRSQLHEK